MILVDFLLVFLILSIFFRISDKYKKISFLINLFLLTIINGTMYENNYGDYTAYKNGFDQLTIGGGIPDKEVVFHLLNCIIKLFTENFNITFIIYILIINYFMLKAIYEFSNYPEASILIYLILGGYTLSINITRQFIALAIYFYSIKYLVNRKFLKFILLSILVISIHQSSIVVIIITLIIRIFNESLYNNFIKYIIIVNLLIVIEPIIRQIGINLLYENYDNDTFNYGSSMLHYLFQFVLIIYYYLNRINIMDIKNKFFINLTVISLGFKLLSQNMVLYARLAEYFNIFNVVLIVNIMSNSNTKRKRVYAYGILVVLICYYLLLARKPLPHFDNHIIDYISNLF